MAFGIVPVTEEPKFTLVSQYSVLRLGQQPTGRVNYVETVYCLESPTEVGEVTASIDGGALDTLQVNAWGGTANLAGRIISLPDSTAVGTITNVVQTELTPESIQTTYADSTTGTTLPTGTTEIARTLGADGKTTIRYANGAVSILTPATYDLRLTVDAPVTLPTGAPVALVAQTLVGTPAYRRADGGRAWELTLSGGQPDAMTRMTTMLGTAFVVAGSELLSELSATLGATATLGSVTADQVSAAVTALGEKGRNLDGYLAEQGEQLEEDRRAGSLPWLGVMGNAPEGGGA